LEIGKQNLTFHASQPPVVVPPSDYTGWKLTGTRRRDELVVISTSNNQRPTPNFQERVPLRLALVVGRWLLGVRFEFQVWRGWGVAWLLILVAASTLAGATPDVWDTLKGKHFIVSHQGNAAFAAEVLHRAELYYDSIVQQLGFKRVDNFWLWERRARIKLYASRQAFIESTGAPDWATAKANVRDRTIESFGNSRVFLESRLPHEMAHLFFREYIGFTGAVPLWLDEGVAQWCEFEPGPSTPPALRKWIPLRVMTTMTVNEIMDVDRAQLFYRESASVVEYLVTTYGKGAFTKFCRQLRDGKRLDRALRFTYPNTISTLELLEQQWSVWQIARSIRNR